MEGAAAVQVFRRERRGEPAHDDDTRPQDDDPGVAVVEWRIRDRLRCRPGFSAILAAHHLRLAVRANMLLAVAGEDDQQFAVRRAGDARPADIITRFLADRPAPMYRCRSHLDGHRFPSPSLGTVAQVPTPNQPTI